MPSLSCAQNTASDQAATLQPRARSAEDLFTLPDSAKFGLRPPVASLRERIQLPYGLSYYRDSKSLLLQPDENSDWGVGLNLNLGNTPGVAPAPTDQLFQSRRTPGLMFQKKF